MRTFVLRARAAPTDSQTLWDAVGKDAHTEILAHTLMNALFVAQSQTSKSNRSSVAFDKAKAL